MNVFTFHSDPSHGWVEVSLADVKGIGLDLCDFSSYSFKRGEQLFLEEDMDAATFIQRWESRKGGLVFREKYLAYSHWIRGLDRIDPGPTDDSIVF